MTVLRGTGVAAFAAMLAWSVPLAAQRAAAPLKVFISVDMEGIDSVTSDDQTSPDAREYSRGRHWMTGEANAAIQGALDAGATDVLVCDSHGPQINLDPGDLVADSRVRVITGRPKPQGMMEGIDGTFAAAVFIGYHPKADTVNGVLSHTWTYTVTDVRLNGTSVGEYGLNSAIAGHYGVPVVFIAGDRAAVEQAKAFIPGIEGVAVKNGIGRFAANTMLPKFAQEAIRKGVAEAVAKRTSIKPVQMTVPIRLEVDFTTTQQADRAARIPGAERVRGLTVAYTAKDAIEMIRAFQALF